MYSRPSVFIISYLLDADTACGLTERIPDLPQVKFMIIYVIHPQRKRRKTTTFLIPINPHSTSLFPNLCHKYAFVLLQFPDICQTVLENMSYSGGGIKTIMTVLQTVGQVSIGQLCKS